MIARIWTGRTRVEDEETYLRYVEETGIVGLRGTAGNRGAWVLRRRDGAEAEFKVLSLWESMDGIRAFAGDDFERAVYYPLDERYLLEKEPKVVHFDLFGSGA